MIMEALAEAHDGSVQMIDTSVVRVHQHGGCAGGDETRLIGRSRGGLTTKIHACVDTNGLPVRLELTTGEAHDNRLVTGLLSDLKPGAILLADRGYDADWIREFVGQRGAWANIRQNVTAKTQSALAPIFTGHAIWSSDFSTGSSNVGGSPRDTTNSRPTTLLSSSSQPFGFGYALMSPSPSLARRSRTFFVPVVSNFDQTMRLRTG
jgi:transposase